MNVREWALPVYTILMQLATGMLFVLWVLRASALKRADEASLDRIFIKPVGVVLLSVVVAIIGSHFHLSNSLISFLALFNLRGSWLSREVFFTVLMLVSCVLLVELILNHPGRTRLKTGLGWLTIALGSASIFSMSSIYLLPVQTPWNNPVTIGLFFGSSLLLGVTAASALLVMDAVFSEQKEPELAPLRADLLRRCLPWAAVLAALALLLIALLNGGQISLWRTGGEPAQTSLALLFGLYRPLLVVRILTLLVGVGLLIIAAYSLVRRQRRAAALVSPVYLALLLTLVAEILGRFLFYATHVRVGI